MKSLLLISTLFLSSAWGNSALDREFTANLPKYGIAPASEQSYCYQKTGQTLGYQPLKVQRIASVSKIITTYFASELMDLNQRFVTKIYVAGKRMHIEGSLDPYWEEDKMLLLMRALNDLGYKNFQSITFDENFIFTDMAIDSHYDITPAHVKARLAYLFGPKSSSYIKTLWLGTLQFAQEEGVRLLSSKVPSMLAKSVNVSAQNPLLDQAPKVYVHSSLPFHRILKSMNVMSKNHVAQNIFRMLSSKTHFDDFMLTRGFDLGDFKIYNGSGLPIEKRARLDNLATCELMLNLSMKLHESLSRHQLELSDVMAVNGGKDLGSFRSRFQKFPETHQAVISKTGTLKQTSSLAGYLLMDELVPFAILNHTTNVGNARSFQDFFVSRMFAQLANPTPLVYKKISIFPWEEKNFLEASHSSALASF